MTPGTNTTFLRLRLNKLKRAKAATEVMKISEQSMREMWEGGDKDDQFAVRAAIIEHVSNCPEERFHYILEAFEGQTREKLEQINSEIDTIEEELRSGG